MLLDHELALVDTARHPLSEPMPKSLLASLLAHQSG
jgi:hypothetical protein